MAVATAAGRADGDEHRVRTRDRLGVLGREVEPPVVDVRMNEGGVLEGVVLDSSGKPLQGVGIRLVPEPGRPLPAGASPDGTPRTLLRK